MPVLPVFRGGEPGSSPAHWTIRPAGIVDADFVIVIAGNNKAYQCRSHERMIVGDSNGEGFAGRCNHNGEIRDNVKIPLNGG